MGSWFSISSGSLPISSLNQGSGSSIISIVCTPPTGSSGTFTDTLSLSTNDPAQSSVNFTLTCAEALDIYPTAPSIVMPAAWPAAPTWSLITIANLSPTIVAGLSVVLSSTSPQGVFDLSSSSAVGGTASSGSMLSMVVNVPGSANATVMVQCRPVNNMEFGEFNATLTIVQQSTVNGMPVATTLRKFLLVCPSAVMTNPASGSIIVVPPSFVFVPSQPVSISLSNIGASPFSISITSSSSSYPQASNGSTSAATFTSGEPQVLLMLEPTSSSPSSGTLYGGGGTADVQVLCIATVVGARSSVVSVSVGAASQMNFTIVCTGVPSILLLPSGSTVDFGSVPVESTSDTRALTVQNLTPEWLTLRLSVLSAPSPSLSHRASPPPPPLPPPPVRRSDCSSSDVSGERLEATSLEGARRTTRTVQASLRTAEVEEQQHEVSLLPTTLLIAPGGTSVLVVQVQPSDVGASSASVLAQTPSMPHAVALLEVLWLGQSGVMMIETPIVRFGSVTVGSMGTTNEVFVFNAGNIDLTVQVVQLLDGSGGAFALASSSSSSPSIGVGQPSLPRPPVVIAPNARAAVVTIECIPLSVRTFTASLELQSSDPNQPSASIPLECEGAASCFDGVRNQDEAGIDCGGSVCAACQSPGSAALLPPTGGVNETESAVTVVVNGTLSHPPPPQQPAPSEGIAIPPVSTMQTLTTVPASLASGTLSGGTTLQVLDGTGSVVATVQLPPLVDASKILVSEAEPTMVNVANSNQPGLASGVVLDVRYVIDGMVRLSFIGFVRSFCWRASTCAVANTQRLPREWM